MPLTAEELEKFTAAADFCFLDVEGATAFLNKLAEAGQRDYYDQILDRATAFEKRLSSPDYARTILNRVLT